MPAARANVCFSGYSGLVVLTLSSSARDPQETLGPEAESPTLAVADREEAITCPTETSRHSFLESIVHAARASPLENKLNRS